MDHYVYSQRLISYSHDDDDDDELDPTRALASRDLELAFPLGASAFSCRSGVIMDLTSLGCGGVEMRYWLKNTQHRA